MLHKILHMCLFTKEITKASISAIFKISGSFSITVLSAPRKFFRIKLKLNFYFYPSLRCLNGLHSLVTCQKEV